MKKLIITIATFIAMINMSCSSDVNPMSTTDTLYIVSENLDTTKDITIIYNNDTIVEDGDTVFVNTQDTLITNDEMSEYEFYNDWVYVEKESQPNKNYMYTFNKDGEETFIELDSSYYKEYSSHIVSIDDGAMEIYNIIIDSTTGHYKITETKPKEKKIADIYYTIDNDKVITIDTNITEINDIFYSELDSINKELINDFINLPDPNTNDKWEYDWIELSFKILDIIY